MTSINIKVFDRPGFEPTGFRFESVPFGFPDLSERDAGVLLIWPSRLVVDVANEGRGNEMGRHRGKKEQGRRKRAVVE